MISERAHKVEQLIRNAAFQRGLLYEVSFRLVRRSRLAFAGLGLCAFVLIMCFLFYPTGNQSFHFLGLAGLCIVSTASIMSYLVHLRTGNANLLRGIQRYKQFRDDVYRRVIDDRRGDEFLNPDLLAFQQQLSALAEDYSNYLRALNNTNQSVFQLSSSTTEHLPVLPDMWRTPDLPWDRMWASSVDDVDGLNHLLETESETGSGRGRL